MISFICGIYKTKKPKYNKLKRQATDYLPEGKGSPRGRMQWVKGGQLCGDRWKLDFW